MMQNCIKKFPFRFRQMETKKNLDANSAKFSKILLTVMNVLPDKSYSIKTSIKMIIVTKKPRCRNLELWSARL